MRGLFLSVLAQTNASNEVRTKFKSTDIDQGGSIAGPPHNFCGL